ncbi:TPA: GNAT family N-acetyltransferase [Candidatus Delongbacteria bacterium]|nr:GNAT family N-acetyltransferase [Candidatus Delongbacteria bacterium]
MKYLIESRKIEVDEFQQMRKTTGWVMLEDSVVERGLERDLHSVCVSDNGKLIGVGRVIGDGAMYFYIQDIIVIPEYQKKGIGRLIMENIEDYIQKKAFNNSFIGLMAANGVKGFYTRYGFIERPDNRPGMSKLIKK